MAVYTYIDRLELLPAIFGIVIIPDKVFQELLVLETDFGRDLSAVKNAPWLVVRHVEDAQAAARFRMELMLESPKQLYWQKRFAQISC